MDLDIEEASLPIYQALASPVRLEILRKVFTEHVTASDLAGQLNISKAAISKNIHMLADAGLLRLQTQAAGDSRKIALSPAVDQIIVHFPASIFPEYKQLDYDIPVGSYFSVRDVQETCGLADEKGVIGHMDDSNVFLLPQRASAHLLWFTRGELEYIIPNELPQDSQLELLEFDMELSSEFPMSNNNWPSRIGFWINDTFVGSMEVPGNFSDVRGRYTPAWWDSNFSQYGLLIHLRVGKLDTSVNSQSISEINAKELEQKLGKAIHFRIAVLQDKDRYGGLTLFGSNFGNHNQDINATVYYSNPKIANSPATSK